MQALQLRTVLTDPEMNAELLPRNLGRARPVTALGFSSRGS